MACPLSDDPFASGPVAAGEATGAPGQEMLATVLDGLAEKGWHVQPGFLPGPLVGQLRGECLARDAAGGFHAAGVGPGKAQRVSEVRGDRILWLEGGDPSSAVQGYLSLMEGLRQAVNAAFFLGLVELEAHFAAYPAGAFYRRHLDRFKDDDRRSLTAIVYLNEDWAEADGGQLRFWPDEAGQGAAMDILPVGGTLVTFLSDRFWHEVLPASRQRLAITGWFKRR